MKKTSFEIEKIYNAPVEKVWAAITDEEQMRQWYFDIPGFKAVPGFEFEFYGGPPEKQFRHLGKVTVVEVNKRLAYTWRYDGYPGESLVTFELFAENGKTRLRLTHEGLETFPPMAEFAKENFAGGWTALIGTQLKDYVERADD